MSPDFQRTWQEMRPGPPKRQGTGGEPPTHASADVGREGSGPDAALYVRRTLRAGQRIAHDGDVIVLGDVHAGAEIRAAGDVLVFGHLQGVVHAGADGSEQAMVCAWRLEPVQLRIAHVIARSPDAHEEVPLVPEIARVQEGQVVIERAVRPEDGRMARG